jgi:DNA-binding NarL/FixJ family response regulator
MCRPIRVLIVDDHAAVRSALAGLFDAAGEVEVVGVASDGPSALELASRLHPDAVLMDYDMPGMNGAEAARRIMAALPQTRVVGLSMHGTEFGGRMREAGAITTVAKGVELEVLVEALRMAVECPVNPQ